MNGAQLFLIILSFSSWISFGAENSKVTDNPMLFDFAGGLNNIFVHYQNECSSKFPPPKRHAGETKVNLIIDNSKYDACIDEKLKIPFIFPLFAGPNKQLEKLGELKMTLGKEGLEFIFSPAKGPAVKFVTDLYHDDWGYGGTLHTVSKKEGNWIQFPKRPFTSPVWMELKDDYKYTKPLSRFHIISIKRPLLEGDFVIDEENEGYLIVHEESGYDMHCGEGPQGEELEIALKKLPRKKIQIKDFMDSDGHLVFSNKYPRGC